MAVVAGVLLDHVDVDPAETDVLVHEAASVRQAAGGAVFAGVHDLRVPGGDGACQRGTLGQLEATVGATRVGTQVVDGRGLFPGGGIGRSMVFTGSIIATGGSHRQTRLTTGRPPSTRMRVAVGVSACADDPVVDRDDGSGQIRPGPGELVDRRPPQVAPALLTSTSNRGAVSAARAARLHGDTGRSTSSASRARCW